MRVSRSIPISDRNIDSAVWLGKQSIPGHLLYRSYSEPKGIASEAVAERIRGSVILAQGLCSRTRKSFVSLTELRSLRIGDIASCWLSSTLVPIVAHRNIFASKALLTGNYLRARGCASESICEQDAAHRNIFANVPTGRFVSNTLDWGPRLSRIPIKTNEFNL